MVDADRLWARYYKIRYDHGIGLWTPILWHLALRRDPSAMYELARALSSSGPTFACGDRFLDPFSSAGLDYRAYRRGEATGAQHLAKRAFNRRDLAGYRTWLRRAAKLGDADCRAELRRFEIRLPHKTAFAIHRGRPLRRNVNYE